MVTIRQIAGHCGVSTATVSKALNHGADISEETAARIREAARTLGYQPNAAARALKTRHSHNLGVLTQLRDKNGLAHEYIATIISAFQADAEKAGYDVTLLSEQLRGASSGYVEHCRYRNLDGVALICGDFFTQPVRELLQSEIPCVSVDSYGMENGAVMTDNEDAMRQLVDYVYDRGHRRLGFITGEESTIIARIRLNCFRKACQARGLDVPDACVKSAYYNDFASTAEATRDLLALPERPTCIFYPDDVAYLGGMGELERLGLSVPRDMSAVGFDGIQLSQAFRPRLTTFRQDADAIGGEALRMLREAIERPKTYLPRQKLIPGRLIPGETVAQL